MVMGTEQAKISGVRNGGKVRGGSVHMSMDGSEEFVANVGGGKMPVGAVRRVVAGSRPGAVGGPEYTIFERHVTWGQSQWLL